MRELTDQDIRTMLQQVEIPAHRPDLAERIIAAATVGGVGAQPQQVKQGEGFTAWWQQAYRRYGAGVAMAASLLVAVMILSPSGQSPSALVEEAQIAVAPVEESYTINGLPLLADVSLVEEPDWEMALLY